MSKTTTSQTRLFIADTKAAPDETAAPETTRNPVRMYAVAMNMRRLAHARRGAPQGR